MVNHGDLGSTLWRRFKQTGDVRDLDGAVDHLRSALAAIPAGDPEHLPLLYRLVYAAQARFDLRGDLADLDTLIQAGQEILASLPEGHPDHPDFASGLGNVLRIRFELSGNRSDLEAAIEAGQAAVSAAPVDDPDRAKYLSNLGIAWRARYDLTRSRADLDAAVRNGRAAVDAAPYDPIGQTNLSNALQDLFHETGDPADLDAAVDAAQSAVDAAPPRYPRMAALLANLGNVLRDRFDQAGGSADLAGAISAGQAAVALLPAGHPDRFGCLANLGVALLDVYERTGLPETLDAAVDAYSAAAESVPPGHYGRTACLSGLAMTLQSRFDLTGSPADLEAAIDASRKALDAPNAVPGGRASLLSQLGMALRTRYEHGGSEQDLTESLTVIQAALNDTGAGHQDRTRRLMNLASTLYARFGRSGQLSDKRAAFDALSEAAGISAAPPSLRIHAAQRAAALAGETELSRTAQLLELAVGLLPQVAPRQISRSDQQHMLGTFAGLVGEAAALALAGAAADHPTEGSRAVKALTLLESGRAVLLSQALETRTDLTVLQGKNPTLAAEFARLRDELDQSADTVNRLVVRLPSAEPSRAARNQRHAAEELKKTLADIRGIDGLESFGLPPDASELTAQASAGPIVVFNVSTSRSDALLVTDYGVIPVHLPGLSPRLVAQRALTFHEDLRSVSAAGTDSSSRIAAQSRLRETLEWLWDNAAGPVLDALGFDQACAAGKEPRIWWAPGGLLGLLPVHAAGYHTDQRDDHQRRTVIDRAVSSYTPTIAALSYARMKATAPPAGRSLIVAIPVTAGIPGRLNYVPAEATTVCSRLPDPIILAEPDALPGASCAPAAPPTKKHLLRYLPECSVAHFACHGISDPGDPSGSRLLLQDHDSDPLTVSSLALVKLDNAKLAYLSACATAFAGTTNLIDETIHLTSAFQLAGFPSVIGTLWPIDSAIAVQVADKFYTSLSTSDGHLNTDMAARALHQAIRHIQEDYPSLPSLWAGYVHAGS